MGGNHIKDLNHYRYLSKHNFETKILNNIFLNKIIIKNKTIIYINYSNSYLFKAGISKGFDHRNISQ